MSRPVARPAWPPAPPRWAWLLFVLLATGGCGGGDAQQAVPGEAATAPAPVPAEGEPDEQAPGQPLRRFTVELYFPAASGNGLIGEYNEIFETVTPGDRVKQIVAELITGPSNPESLPAVPQGTRLRQAYVLDDGTAFLDFSSDLVEGVGGGSMEELLTVYSIVDSVVLNVTEIRRVGILIEGEVIETLNGHMDLRRPLTADSTLILGPTVVRFDPGFRPLCSPVEPFDSGLRPSPGSGRSPSLRTLRA